MDKEFQDDKLNESNVKFNEKLDLKSIIITNAAVQPANFETAISATSFGKFNIILFLIALPSAWSSEFDFTSISYVLPAAQCDLKMTLVDKGWLNTATYFGTLTSAFLWGFLADTLGRRKLLIFGYFADAAVVLMSSLSQDFWTFFLMKFMNGFLICGPYAVLMSFISEFHCARYRAPILLLTGIFFSLANVALSGLAWWIIPRDISFSLFSGHVEIHSWQVFLVVCALPSLTSGCAYVLLPESPKFLMTAGRSAEALKVFQRVYAMNTGNPPEYYPIKQLIDEREQIVTTEKCDDTATSTCKNTLLAARAGWKQIRPIFLPPYLIRIVHIYLVLCLGMLGENTLRLWLPQLFTKMDEYNQLHNYSHSATLCEMLEVSNPTDIGNDSGINFENICTVTTVDSEVYVNTIIVGLCNVMGFIVASSVVNKIGKKWLLVVIYAACGFSAVANYWSTSSTITLILVSIYGGVASVCTTTLISVMVDLFPTALRTMTISLGMMTGRSGSIIGNVLFPVLLQTGCLPPFLLIGGTALVCSLLCLFLPDLKPKNLL